MPQNHKKQGNSVTRNLPPTGLEAGGVGGGGEAQKLSPPLGGGGGGRHGSFKGGRGGNLTLPVGSKICLHVVTFYAVIYGPHSVNQPACKSSSIKFSFTNYILHTFYTINCTKYMINMHYELFMTETSYS